MLLNYQKPVQASSTLGGFQPNLAVDEDIKTYWSAKTGNAGEWYQTDLGDISTVNAIQINYADQDAEFLGKTLNKMHQYKIYASNDGKSWKTIVDKSKNQKDVPHDYIELETPVKARFLKMENLKMPTGKFALSGFRVFGKGTGAKPSAVENFVALRAEPRKMLTEEAYGLNGNRMISQMVMLSILANLRTNYTEALWCMVRMNTTLQEPIKVMLIISR